MSFDITPVASGRADRMRETADELAKDANRNWGEAKDETQLAGEFSQDAFAYAVDILNQAVGAGTNAIEAGASVVVGTAEGVAATGVAVGSERGTIHRRRYYGATERTVEAAGQSLLVQADRGSRNVQESH